MGRWRWFVGIVLVVVLGAGGSFAYYAAGRRAARSAGPQVRVARVRREDVVQTVQAPGTVAPLQDLTVHSRAAGALTALPVQVGDRVKAGQIIARLDDRDLQAAVQQAEQALAAAEFTLAAAEKRAQAAPGQNQANMQAAELSLQQATAGLTAAQAAARQQLDKARLDLQSLREREGNGGVAPGQFTRDLAEAMQVVQAASDNLAALAPDAATAGSAVFAVRTARTQFDRARLDAEQNAVLPEELTADRTAVAVAQGNLALARQKLADAAVAAPFAGVVLDLPVKAGDVLAAGAPIARLGVTDQVLVKLTVDETDVGGVLPGQAVQITASAYLEQPLHGTVQSILPLATPGLAGGASTFEVRVIVDNPGGRLRTGMSVNAEITTGQAQGALVIEQSAILDRGDHKAVLMLSGNRAYERTVTTGLKGITTVEIKDGLQAGDAVAISPYQTLKQLHDGDRVRIGTGTATPAPGGAPKGGGGK